MVQEPEIRWGLDGVYVKESGICLIDLDNAKIYYRGYELSELALKSTFEETAYLILKGKLPSKAELSEFSNELAMNRELPKELLTFLKGLPGGLRPIDVLRLSIDYLGTLDKEAVAKGPNEEGKAIRLIAIAPTIVATYRRLITDGSVPKPRSDLNHVANYFYMFFGREPNDEELRALETMFITYMEHGMNNSSFTAVTVASTLTDIYSVIVAALSSLKGPLHGGAIFEALKTILEVGDPSRAEEYIVNKLRRGEKIIGFGSRIYRRLTDPRVSYLRELAHKLAMSKGGEYLRLYEAARTLEDVVERYLSHKNIHVNIDFYASLIYYTLGFPMEYNPANFALARIVGWVAHVLEYWGMGGKLIRPMERYVGPRDLRYIPIDERG